MSVPTITVAVEFTAGVWTDITSYVDLKRGIRGMGHGRRDERAETSAYAATMVLNNQDGRFTPDNPDSPYFPNVTLGKRVRVSVTVGATTSDRFTGHVSSWPVEFPGGTVANGVLTITDRLGEHDSRHKFRSVPSEAILSYGPGAYWSLGDPEGTTVADEESGNEQNGLTIRQYGTGGEIKFGEATGVPHDGMSSVSFTPADISNGLYLAADLTKPIGDGTRIGVACTFNIATTPAAPVVLVELNDLSSTWRFQVLINAAGQVYQKEYWPDTGAYFDTWLNRVVTDGESHAVSVLSYVSGSVNGISMRLDGVDFFATSRTKHDLWPVARVFVGGDPWGGDLFTGSIGHVAVFGAGFDPGNDLPAHMRYGLDGHAIGDTIADIRTWAGIDVADVVLPPPGFDLDVYGTGMAHRPTEEQSPAGMMLAINRDEGGVVFVDGSGRYVFQERSHRWATSDPVLTIDTRNLDGDSLAMAYDTQNLANDVEVSRPGGGHKQRVVNQESVDAIGTVSASLELALPTESEMVARAGWEANTRATPYVRVSELPIDLLTMDATTTEAALALTVGDRIAIGPMPAQAPEPTLALDIEGWTEDLALDVWTMTVNTSRPVSDRLLVLDDARTALDSGLITGY